MTALRMRFHRTLVRAPNWLYRARLGWLLGHRFLMIEHRGRITGLTRRTTLEVTRRGPGSEWVEVVAGFGATTDWYRNAVAAGEVRVHLGTRQFTADVAELDEGERLALLTDYQTNHPKSAAVLGTTVVRQPFTGADHDLAALARQLPALRLTNRQFRLDPAPVLASTEADDEPHP
ncbi:nitroreductase family deazaflavin-dependent oxidoreductase [Lysobacter korlensis]|uniref:Nitroreductase family deazaflavin-dependent oxidoreductase n=1 Tax=Lysobacter korlensis TaxID=553636 RepID=A0ABV6RWK7_9GAMM